GQCDSPACPRRALPNSHRVVSGGADSTPRSSAVCAETSSGRPRRLGAPMVPLAYSARGRPLAQLPDTSERTKSALTLPPSLRRNREVDCDGMRSEEHTSELQSRGHLVCRLLLEKKNH